MADEILTGVVKSKNPKGFGFIAVVGRDKDVFFHSSDLVGVTFDELKETIDNVPGDTVTFGTKQTEKGVNATNVQRVAPQAAAAAA
jgi:CspA family cold shock protein